MQRFMPNGAQLDMLVIEKDFSSGGQMVEDLRGGHYPGLPGMSGYDMAEAFRGHADKLGAYLSGRM